MAPELPPPTKLPRPWYRLHAVSWLVMALVTAAMGFWNVAGYYGYGFPYERPDTGQEYQDEAWLYGWPATYLHRSITRVPIDEGMGFADNTFNSARLDDLTWRLWNRVVYFQAGYLCLDAIAAVGIILACGAVAEAWRRRRKHVLQLYLSEIFLLVFLAAAALGVGRYLIVDAQSRELELSKIVDEKDTRGLFGQNRGAGEFRTCRALPECLWACLPGKAFKAGDRLTEFRQWNSTLSAENAEAISRHRQLRTARFFSVDFQPESLEKLAACPRLEQIQLRECRISNERLQALSSFPALRVLLFSSNDITSDTFRSISQISTLKEIRFTDSEFTTPKLEQFAALVNLRRLDLPFNAKTRDCKLDSIHQLQQLRDLRISGAKLTSGEVDSLARLANLRVLNLERCDFMNGEAAGRLIDSLPRLEELHIGVTDTPQSVLQAISRLEFLKELSLFGGIGDDDFRWITQVAALRTLSFGGKVSDAGLEQLTTLEDLESLRIFSATLTDKAVDSLVKMKGA